MVRKLLCLQVFFPVTAQRSSCAPRQSARGARDLDLPDAPEGEGRERVHVSGAREGTQRRGPLVPEGGMQ